MFFGSRTIKFRILALICVISVLTTTTLTILAYVEATRQMVDVGGELFTKINHDVLAWISTEWNRTNTVSIVFGTFAVATWSPLHGKGALIY
jgi:hypothetical protein